MWGSCSVFVLQINIPAVIRGLVLANCHMISAESSSGAPAPTWPTNLQVTVLHEQSDSTLVVPKNRSWPFSSLHCIAPKTCLFIVIVTWQESRQESSHYNFVQTDCLSFRYVLIPHEEPRTTIGNLVWKRGKNKTVSFKVLIDFFFRLFMSWLCTFVWTILDDVYKKISFKWDWCVSECLMLMWQRFQ